VLRSLCLYIWVAALFTWQAAKLLERLLGNSVAQANPAVGAMGWSISTLVHMHEGGCDSAG